MSFIPTIPRTLDTGDSNLRWLKSYLEGWIERKTEIRVSHEQHEGHWHGGIDRYGALGALLETDGSFDPLYLLSDDWTQVSKVHSRDAIEGVLTGIASVSYEGYNAFVLYLNQMAKLHALVWDTEETEGDRRSAQAEYQRHARPTRESFKTLIEGYLAQVLADTSTSKDRLAERLVEIAEQHRRWLLGGTGSPRSSQEESASDAIEGHVRSGIIAIQRQPQLTGAQTEFERARLAVLGVHMDGVAPRFRVAGAANDLRAGSIIPTVADGTPPFLAGHIEAYLPHVDEPVWIESVGLDETKLEWRRAANVRGAQRIGLYWKVAGATGSENVILKARGAVAARSLAIVVPPPRAST